MGALDGKVVALTGAGSNIGRACALLAAREGARVVVNDRGVDGDGLGNDDSRASQVVSEIKQAGGEAVANFSDVSTMEGGASVIQTAVDTFGRLDGLVNLAAIMNDRSIFGMSEEAFDSVIRINLKGHFTTCKAAAEVMRRQRAGRIVNFSSGAALKCRPGELNYAASKGGVYAMTRVLARELGRYGVTVNTIVPSGSSRTPTGESSSRLSERYLERRIDVFRELEVEDLDAVVATIEQQKESRVVSPNSPDKIAPMVCYLLSDGAAMINGQAFQVDAGHVGILQDLYPPFRNIHKLGGEPWTVAELAGVVPQQLMAGIPNPTPTSTTLVAGDLD